MSSREKTLAAVRVSQPPAHPLPAVPEFTGEASVEKFTALLQGIGGQVVELPDLPATVARLYPADYRVASALVPATVPVHTDTPVAELAPIDLAILRGEFGVAENGSVWLPEANMLHRALPTIAQHLVLVLDRAAIVATMH